MIDHVKVVLNPINDKFFVESVVPYYVLTDLW